jgi:hypothetical protein
VTPGMMPSGFQDSVDLSPPFLKDLVEDSQAVDDQKDMDDHVVGRQAWKWASTANTKISGSWTTSAASSFGAEFDFAFVISEEGDTMIEPMTVERRVSIWDVVMTFRERLRGVNGVEGVLGSQGADAILLSVVVNNMERELRRQIYNCEMELMERFLGTEFDFHVLDRRNRPLCDLVSVELSDVYLRA